MKLKTIHYRTENTPVYLDPKFPIEQRVADLLSQMTLEEKVAQMLCVWQKKAGTLVNEAGEFDPEKARDAFPHGLGQIGRLSDTAGGRSPRQMAQLANAIQKFFMENL